MSARRLPPGVLVSKAAGRRTRGHATTVGRRELRFLIYRVGNSLAVERRQRAEDGVASLAVLHFDHREAFDIWWREDSLRFDNPILHQALQRDVTELWELDDGPP